jgi:hypothetical protein
MSREAIALIIFATSIALGLVFTFGVAYGRTRSEREIRNEHDRRQDLRTALNTLDWWFRDQIRSIEVFRSGPTSDGMKRWHQYTQDAIERDNRNGEKPRESETKATGKGT